jgi:hypothetical protein
MTKTWYARLMGTLATLAITAGLLTVTSTPAAAAGPVCNFHPNEYNVCIRIDPVGGDQYRVALGLDDWMTTVRARLLVNGCDHQMFATMRFFDGGGAADDGPFWLDRLPGWPAVGTNVMSAEFAHNFSRSFLDEDAGADWDEIYADVTYFDCITGVWVTYVTPNIVI